MGVTRGSGHAALENPHTQQPTSLVLTAESEIAPLKLGAAGVGGGAQPKPQVSGNVGDSPGGREGSALMPPPLIISMRLHSRSGVAMERMLPSTFRPTDLAVRAPSLQSATVSLKFRSPFPEIAAAGVVA